MKHLLQYIVAGISAFLFLSLRSSAQDIQLDSVSRPADEINSQVYSITQDNKGFLWFGTGSGLYKYDGFQYTVYHYQPTKPNGLSSDAIECVMADRQGYIWIGHYHNSSGIERLDPSTGIFTHYEHREDDINSLSSDSVTTIMQDREGTIWIGTQIGLNRFDALNNRFDQYHHKENDPASLSSDQIRPIYEDKQGTLWVGTGDPWDISNGRKEGGLNKMDKITGKFTRYLHKENDRYSLTDNRIGAIFEDSHGNFWVGSSGEGLHKMDRATGNFERFPYNPAHPNGLSRPPVQGQLIGADDHITFISEDIRGRLLIGTYHGGLNVYDPKTKTSSFYGLGKNSKQKLSENDFWTAYRSNDGLTWVTTWGGALYKINPDRFAVPYTNIGSNVFAFEEDSAESLWLATPSGLLRRDPKGAVQKFLIDKDSSSSKNVIIYIEKYDNDRFWLSTLHGLYHFDHSTNKIDEYRPENGNNSEPFADGIEITLKDKYNHLWIGTEGMGLKKMDLKTGSITKYEHNPADSNSIDDNIVYSLATDNNEKLWVGTLRGLSRLDSQTGHFKKYLRRQSVFCIKIDSEGDIWVATATGLFKYDRNDDIFLLFNDQSGILKSNWGVFWIEEDHQQVLWMSTARGILRLNKERNEAVMFGKNQGLDPQISNFGYTRKNGDVLFGDSSGYFTFNSKLLLQDTSRTEVNITGFFLNDIMVEPSPNGILTAPLEQTGEIRLPHDLNTFSFKFSVIDFISKHEDTRVLYMMQNYDNNWRLSDESREAYYFNLPPGKYFFKVKAFGANNRSAEKQVAVVITPPWWTSWWVYLFYGLCLIAGILFTDRIFRKKVIEKERERTRERELAQAKEIEKAYTDLKQTQAQLIQSEKMASLGELTAGIAHEIQNPLNFVNNFSEVNTELIDEAESAINAGKSEEAKELLANLRNNQVKINQHGKRADAIVKGMLQHSRTSTNIKEPTDINALADEYFRLAYHGLKAQDRNFNATMKTNYDPTIGKINIIPQDIGRVLLNLYNNAFYTVSEKKMHEAESFIPTVLVSTRRLNGKVEIIVKDNGNGIPQKVADKIFQPFFTTKPAGKGTGLGLSLSYDIIKSHGGQIHVQSKEGEGAEFVIQLPG